MPRAHHRPVLTPLPGVATDLGLVDALAELTFTVQAAIGRVAAIYDLSIVQARLLGILRDRQPTIKELAGFLQLRQDQRDRVGRQGQERGGPGPAGPPPPLMAAVPRLHHRWRPRGVDKATGRSQPRLGLSWRCSARPGRAELSARPASWWRPIRAVWV